VNGTAQRETPHVGIFWLAQTSNGKARLLAAGCPLDQAEPYGDCLTYGPGHYETWAQWRRDKTVAPALRALVRDPKKIQTDPLPHSDRLDLSGRAASLAGAMSFKYKASVLNFAPTWDQFILISPPQRPVRDLIEPVLKRYLRHAKVRTRESTTIAARPAPVSANRCLATIKAWLNWRVAPRQPRLSGKWSP
jgi:hypothetical protein